jgi:hypothetical protein
MKHSAMASMDTTALINDYEQLRESFLRSPSSAATRPCLKRLVGEGLSAWVMTRKRAQPNDLARTDDSAASTAELNASDAIVQLMASMTLRSLTEETHDYLQ